jgi:excisionase family DNA binding protein
MNSIQILLADEQLNNLKTSVYQTILQEIDKARKDVGLENRYMTKGETGKYLHVSNNTLDKFIQEGMPVIKIGTVTRYDKQAIDEWLANKY